MKHSLCAWILAVALPSSLPTRAVCQSRELTNHWQVGVGAAISTTTTYWYRYVSQGTASRSSFPIHVFERPHFLVFAHTPGFLELGPLRTNARIEGLFGFIGGTREDWLPAGETISEGGALYGCLIGLRFMARLPLSGLSLCPYITPAFQFTALVSDGTGVGTQFASRPEYSYAYEWMETLTTFTLCAGAELRLGRVSVSPEYRFVILGGADTDWDPSGSVEQDVSPSASSLVLSVGLFL